MEHHVHFYAIAGRFIHGDVENSVSFSAVNVYNSNKVFPVDFFSDEWDGILGSFSIMLTFATTKG